MLPLLILITQSIFALAQTGSFNVSANLNLLSPAPAATSIITIPVVVHVVYNTAQQNISDAQIISQLEVLNKDYREKNQDTKNIPSYFAKLAGDAGFEFQLARVDPSGYATTGIIRKSTSIKMFGTDDRIKYNKIGGDDAWDKNKYLNIWIGNLAGGILGYTSTVGGSADKDGVVIQYTAFGTTGTVSAPFNLGRTATHEIGHWLNLKHIWGDAFCGSDEVDDTPKQRASNRGRPTGEKFTCEMNGHGDMYMNFMDLTEDAGMFMFTKGQCERMRALFLNAGQRSAILLSNAITGKAIIKSELIPTPSLIAKLISAYPNPAQSTITIDLSGYSNESAKTILIYNYTGQPVITQTITVNRVSVNISQLKTGIYFIKSGDGAPSRFVKN